MTRSRYPSDAKPRNRKTKSCECGALIRPESAQCNRCAGRARAGEKNPAWRGGVSVRADGYRLVRVLGHHRGQGQNGYVLEHVLVMEQTLGRPLMPDENVHHKNGIRDDNRPENLELWVRPQPKGIRASDAVEHAVEMLRRYAPERLS